MKFRFRDPIFAILVIAVGSCFNAYAQEADPTDELPPGWIQLPKTPVRLKVGGYVKFDLIHDFNAINSPDFFDVSKIPIDDSEGESTHLHAKETRLFLDFRAPSKVGNIKAYVEGDFYGTGGALRLRHGYVEIADKWLAGQTWSNFMDESMIPPTLDFEKPAAYAFARHGLLRYKLSFKNSSYVALALEEPSTTAQAPAEPGKLESPLPDLTARYRINKPWGHVQVSGFAAQLRFQSTTGDKQDISLYGVNLSGQFVLLKKDRLSYQIVYGPGVARYRGGLSAGPDGNDDLESLTALGCTASYLHYWSDAFSSLIVYNFGKEDNTAGQPVSSVARTNYIAANLLWHFMDNAFAGLEYLRGTREDIDDSSGTANRIQFSISYAFNTN